MYQPAVSAAAVVGGASLAFTGLNTAHVAVAAFAMIFAGVALLHMLPKRITIEHQ